MASSNLAKLAYLTLQQSKSIAGLAHKELSSKLMELLIPEAKPNTDRLSNELLLELRRSISELEKLDWQEAEQGIYPKSQLFDAPWLDWASKYPLIWLDMPSTWQRRKKNKTREIPKNIDASSYPDYYLQNFHHQTDGYLSDHSASLYDLQVEILFNGTADAMRRRILSPLKSGLKDIQGERSMASLRILDVATGTGRTLKQIRSALPEVELLGLDLSASYLKQASRYLNTKEVALTQLVRGNAEQMPFVNESMQAITCVFLLHELPRKARQNVLDDCFRLLEPGGTFVLADSIQIVDSPQFSSVMNDFHKTFHEPYYRDYISDNIEERLLASGFKKINKKSHFMTKVWSAIKPK